MEQPYRFGEEDAESSRPDWPAVRRMGWRMFQFFAAVVLFVLMAQVSWGLAFLVPVLWAVPSVVRLIVSERSAKRQGVPDTIPDEWLK